MFGPDLGKLSELMERLTKAGERIADSMERKKRTCTNCGYPNYRILTVDEYRDWYERKEAANAATDPQGTETAHGKSVEPSSHGQ